MRSVRRDYFGWLGVAAVVLLSCSASRALAAAPAPTAPATAAGAAQGTFKTDLDLNIPRDMGVGFIEPAQPGRYVLVVWSGSPTRVAVMDLQTGKLPEPVKSDASLSNSRLDRADFSRDGRFYTGTFLNQALYDAATGKLVAKLPEADRVLAFRPDGSLLIDTSTGAQTPFALVDGKTGKLLRGVAGNPRVGGGSTPLAVTPDGKYMAFAARAEVTLVPVDAGDKLRSLPMPEKDTWGADRLSFSSDGKLLAGTYHVEIGGKLMLVVWDVASGKLLPSTGQPKPAERGGLTFERTFRFFPESTLILCEKHAIDARTGKATPLKIPATTHTLLGLTPLGPRHVLVMYRDDKATDLAKLTAVAAD